MFFPTSEKAGVQVLSRNYFIQQATTLLKFAKEIRDPTLAVRALDKAAELSEHAEEAPEAMDVMPLAPEAHPH